jgi:hypothetical protein
MDVTFDDDLAFYSERALEDLPQGSVSMPEAQQTETRLDVGRSAVIAVVTFMHPAASCIRSNGVCRIIASIVIFRPCRTVVNVVFAAISEGLPDDTIVVGESFPRGLRGGHSR